MNEIISVKQLSKSYGGLTAVQSLDLPVMQGTVFGLFIAASSYVPPVDIKMAALNNQNRRWKERLDMGNRPAQQRFFSFLPLGRSFTLATHPIKMEFSKLLLHRLYFWSFLRQAHHYVVP